MRLRPVNNNGRRTIITGRPCKDDGIRLAGGEKRKVPSSLHVDSDCVTTSNALGQFVYVSARKNLTHIHKKSV